MTAEAATAGAWMAVAIVVWAMMEGALMVEMAVKVAVEEAQAVVVVAVVVWVSVGTAVEMADEEAPWAVETTETAGNSVVFAEMARG